MVKLSGKLHDKNSFCSLGGKQARFAKSGKGNYLVSMLSFTIRCDLAAAQ